jgi:hypothetical protein
VKPRLLAPITDEDLRVWFDVMERLQQPVPPSGTLFWTCTHADRSSGYLMLGLGKFWRRCDDPPVRHIVAAYAEQHFSPPLVCRNTLDWPAVSV